MKQVIFIVTVGSDDDAEQLIEDMCEQFDDSNVTIGKTKTAVMEE